MYQFQSLEEISMQALAQCFNGAFSDYEQPICFTPESLRYYLTASAVDLSLSYGAFREGELVAFILNAKGAYQGENVVFDAGTGVIPQHRGKKVFSALFAYTCQQLRRRGITRYILEALQSNHHAVSIYRKKGFSVQREYSVLTASGAAEGWEAPVDVMPYGEFERFPTKISPEPSFEHTTYNIGQNPQLYEVRYVPGQAYCIYAKRNGEIIQLHYNAPEALKQVMAAVIRRYPSAMAKNIDCGCTDVLQILQQLGFREITRQYEMGKDLSAEEKAF